MNVWLLSWLVVASLWLTYMPTGLGTLFSFSKFRREFVKKVPEGRQIKLGNRLLIFEFTVREIKSRILEKSIASAIDACFKKGVYSNSSIFVISDGEQDAGDDPIVTKIIVPQEYRVDGAVMKARALQYGIQRIAETFYDLSDVWILHLDEESLVSEQTVGAVCDFILQGKRLIAEGPIFYPNTPGKGSGPASLTEAVRSSGCYSCMLTMQRGKLPLHLHGSNLLVRADAEKEIGWANGETVAEDQLFGIKAFEKFPRGLGWHGGLVLEQPPITLRDHYRQRKRWAVGILQNLREMPRGLKLRSIYRVAAWLAGFTGALISVPLWLETLLNLPYQFVGAKVVGSLQTPFLTGGELLFDLMDGDITRYLKPSDLVPIALGILTLANLGLWLWSYLLGIYLNNWDRTNHARPSSPLVLQLLKDCLLFLALIPVIGLIESYPVLGAFKDRIFGKEVQWPVTPKLS